MTLFRFAAALPCTLLLLPDPLPGRTARPGSFVCVAGYGECGPGFVPPEKAWDESDSNLQSWCWVAPGSEARMDTAIRRALVGE